MLKCSNFENTEGLRFGLRFLYFLKIWSGIFSILSGIKNQIDSIKTQCFIQKWSALTGIFKKVIGHFDFRSLKMGSGASKIHFLQHVDSQEDKKFSRTVTILIFFFQRKVTYCTFQICKNKSGGGRRHLRPSLVKQKLAKRVSKSFPCYWTYI